MKDQNQKNPYADIIHLSRPESGRYAKMSMVDRGAQFSPFAALTGYDAAIRETERLTDQRVELDEGGKALVDEQLRLVAEHLEEMPCITVTWFRPDQWKAGGAYITVTGNVKRVDEYRRLLMLTDGQEIPIDEICHMVCHQGCWA